MASCLNGSPRLGNTSPVTSEAEMEKRLFATAKAGERFLVLDNMEKNLKSASLEMFITSSTYSGRVLGTSRNETIPKKTATFITGNNLVVSPDMRRRGLEIQTLLAGGQAGNPRNQAPARPAGHPGPTTADTRSTLRLRPGIASRQEAGPEQNTSQFC